MCVKLFLWGRAECLACVIFIMVNCPSWPVYGTRSDDEIWLHMYSSYMANHSPHACIWFLFAIQKSYSKCHWIDFPTAALKCTVSTWFQKSYHACEALGTPSKKQLDTHNRKHHISFLSHKTVLMSNSDIRTEYKLCDNHLNNILKKYSLNNTVWNRSPSTNYD